MPKTQYICPKCEQKLEDYEPECPGCQADLLHTDTRTEEVRNKSINKNDQSVFFYVSLPKLAVMSICTFGIYNLFWFYKNWTYVDEHTNKPTAPIINAIFSPLTYFGLVQQIGRAGAQQGISMNGAMVVLPVLYFFSILLARFFALAAFLPVLTLLPVQHYVNSLNKNSPTPINNKLTVINWVAIVIGGALTILGVIASFIPDLKN